MASSSVVRPPPPKATAAAGDYNSTEDAIEATEGAFPAWRELLYPLKMQELCLQALTSLRPNDSIHRFRLGLFLVDHGRTAEGLSKIVKLAPEIGPSCTDACVWLAEQAMQPEPLLELPPEVIERQLQLAISGVTNHAEAQRLLAMYYTSRGEWLLADLHLSRAARIRPELNLALARLRNSQNFSAHSVQEAATKAVDALAAKLEQDRTNPAVRAQLAEALFIAGLESRARQVLISGEIPENQNPVLISALCSLDLAQAERRLAESPYNRDNCVAVVSRSLERDPSTEAMELLFRLQRMGATVSADSLEGTLTYRKKQVEENPRCRDSTFSGPVV